MLLVGLVLSTVVGAAETDLAADAVVATRGDASLTVGLIDQQLARMPAEVRTGYAEDPDLFARMVDQLLLSVQLAAEAESQGLTVEGLDARAPDAELERVHALTSALLKRTGERALKDDAVYEQLARERYRARKAQYSTEASFSVRRILIDKTAHGDMAAKLLAGAVHKRLLDGEDLVALAEQFGSDSHDAEKVAEVPVSEVLKTNTPLHRALTQLGLEPGISDVVEGSDGYYIFELLKYTEPVVRSWEEVRDGIIDSLKSEAAGNARSTLMRSYSLQDVVLHDELLPALAERYQHVDGNPPEALRGYLQNNGRDGG